MKLLLLPLLMAVFATCQVYGEDSNPREDADFWTSSNQIQDGWMSNPYPVRELLRRMTRKPRPHQFIGLMGKRSMAANAQITHKRHKINSFVGLMGKRSEEEPGHKINSFVGLMGKRSEEEPDSYEWSTIQSYDKRR